MEKIYIRDRKSPMPKDELMNSIKAKDAKAELIFRRFLWQEDSKGYRTHWKKAQGRPDIAFPKKELIIFSMHGYPYYMPIIPKTSSDFWEHEFKVNTERNYKKQIELENMGWIIITIWECQITKDLPSHIRPIKELL